MVEHKEFKDSNKRVTGYGKTFGIMLMILSVVGDLLAMLLIGFDAFIPVTIGAAVLFVIGFLMTIFGQ